MSFNSSILMNSKVSILSSEQGRKRLVASILGFTENMSIAASVLERDLLDRFVLGELTIDEVVSQLEGLD